MFNKEIYLYGKKYTFQTSITFIYVLYYTIYCLYKFYSKQIIYSKEVYDPINLLGFQILCYLFLSFFAAMNPVTSFTAVKKGVVNRKKKNKKYFDIGNINIIRLDNKLTPYLIFTLLNIFFLIILYVILYLPLSYFGVVQYILQVFSDFESSRPYWGVIIFLLTNMVYILLNPKTSYNEYYSQLGIYLWSLSLGFGICGFFVLINIVSYFNLEETKSNQLAYKSLYALVMWFTIIYFTLNYLKKREKEENQNSI